MFSKSHYDLRHAALTRFGLMGVPDQVLRQVAG
jgi:hypothetical protein